GLKPQLSGKRFGSPQDALKQLRPDRGAERVDSQGAPVAEGTATVGGKREVWQAAGKVGAATSRYVSLNDERNAAKYIQNAREAERRGRVAGAHSLYAITLSLYYGLGDIAGAREAHEGMARTGIAILTKFFNDVIVPQIDRGDRERLKVNFSGFFTNMGFVEEHLWRTWALDPQKLSISMLESILFDERDGIAGQTLAWVAGILKAPDIVEAAREALPHLRELFPLLELTLRGRVNLLFERVDKLKTAGAADLTFIRKGYEYIRIFIRENILVEEQGPLLARVDNAISKMFEQGTQRTMPCKPVLWSPPVVEGYKGPRIIPFSTIALSQSETPNQRLERAALLKKKEGWKISNGQFFYTCPFFTRTTVGVH
ncbi:MAG: hypothetical protein HY877_03870, partial [Deltaproteobacteria bacterium]|nr:hypothetical protein [Deltaproteobacteria bacterium]